MNQETNQRGKEEDTYGKEEHRLGKFRIWIYADR